MIYSHFHEDIFSNIQCKPPLLHLETFSSVLSLVISVETPSIQVFPGTLLNLLCSKLNNPSSSATCYQTCAPHPSPASLVFSGLAPAPNFLLLWGSSTDIMTYRSTNVKILQPEALEFQISLHATLWMYAKKSMSGSYNWYQSAVFHIICLTLAIYYECLINGSLYLEKRIRNVDKKLHSIHNLRKIYIQSAFALASVGHWDTCQNPTGILSFNDS